MAFVIESNGLMGRETGKEGILRAGTGEVGVEAPEEIEEDAEGKAREPWEQAKAPADCVLGKTRRGGSEEKTGAEFTSSSDESFPLEEDENELNDIRDDVPKIIISDVGVTGEQLSTDEDEDEELSLRISIADNEAVTVSREFNFVSRPAVAAPELVDEATPHQNNQK